MHTCISQWGQHWFRRGCHIFGTKPLSESMLAEEPLGTYLNDIWFKIQHFFFSIKGFKNVFCKMVAISLCVNVFCCLHIKGPMISHDKWFVSSLQQLHHGLTKIWVNTGSRWHQVIIWTCTNYPSMGYHGIQLRLISQEVATSHYLNQCLLIIKGMI